jgi:hypothetical protein
VSDPLAKLVQLRARVAGVLREQGLSLIHLAVVPTEGDGPHEIHIVAAPEGDVVSDDDGFEGVLRSAHLADTELRAQRAQDDLRQALEQGDGFLPPPPFDGDA